MIYKKAEITHDYKRNYTKRIIVIIIGLIIIACLLQLIHIRIKSTVDIEQKDVLATILASYWGAIIGGILSGALSFFGVFYTIRYYKESDEQRQRVSVQPFLLAEIVHDAEFKPSFITFLGDSIPDKSNQKEINIKISNIGNGYAKLRLMISGENKKTSDFPRVLKINEAMDLQVVIDIYDLPGPIDFSLQYIDSMTNEYIQKFIIRSEVALMDIESDYPQLCKS